MAILANSKFTKYKKLISSLSPSLETSTLKNEKFLVDKDEKKNLEIYYAPFEYINDRAKVIIVGITPGLHQMKQSYSTVIRLKDKEMNDEEILHEVKKNSSFEGPMRKNLIAMLDELELHRYLGLNSTSELFSTASHLVQTTSVIKYPVFYKGKNYNGSTPNILRTDLLRKYIVNTFAAEIIRLERPLIIPLGVNVSKVLTYLTTNDYLNSDSILYGFPHTSGGNGHRHKQFAENKEEMKRKIKLYFE
ncbi:hypothetical protein [Gottfriedia acidiceleris]|uniref:Uracil DNA glycosylase superfamily protein n=1 Tax=Gottfriedia acidiceleris TaxID=371036 RepID=A0ABY4JRV1_9BACI|nr:hypothetical protein [Gottfriedia acidiceleris]UPM55397.1 hypothetical protein MY490_06010 [Gottfriedia acidiceleris]